MDSKDRIFEHGDDCRIDEISLSKPLHRRNDRFHQILKVRYVADGNLYQKEIWLKYRRNFAAMYAIHADVYAKLEGDDCFVPKPYFSGEWNELSVIGMELVRGACLRDVVLKRVAFHKVGELEDIFLRMGMGMRRFHDVSTTGGVRRVNEVVAHAHAATTVAQGLRDDQRRRIIGHLQTAERHANAETPLPLIRIHNDWILRNVLIGPAGTFHVIDLDSMRAPNNSRWYDVCYFLINLESQLKYWPVIGMKGITCLWRRFWQGYVGKELPDRLTGHQVTSLIYVMKVQFFLGATIRPPLFEIYNKALGPLYLRTLLRSLLEGEYSTLAVEI